MISTKNMVKYLYKSFSLEFAKHIQFAKTIHVQSACHNARIFIYMCVCMYVYRNICMVYYYNNIDNHHTVAYHKYHKTMHKDVIIHMKAHQSKIIEAVSNG